MFDLGNKKNKKLGRKYIIKDRTSNLKVVNITWGKNAGYYIAPENPAHHTQPPKGRKKEGDMKVKKRGT